MGCLTPQRRLPCVRILVCVEDNLFNRVAAQASEFSIQIADEFRTNSTVEISSSGCKFTIRVRFIGLNNPVIPSVSFDISDNSRDTVCVYRTLDGRLCVGFLQDETTWSTSAFRFLPDSACGIGFGVDAFSNLLGSQGIVLSYNDKGNAITEYYLLKDKDAFLLYKGIGISKVEDLDGNGDSELLVKENGKTYLFYAEDGKISKCDIEATIVSFGIGGDEMRVEMSKEKSNQLLLYKKIIHTNGTLRERKMGNIFFYNNKLFYYCLED